jgi:biotin carboxyl carrier protein
MKMENTITAERDCIISKICVKEGEQVSASKVLMELDYDE